VFCRDCGQKVEDDWVVCPKCGMAQDELNRPLTYQEKERIREEEHIRSKERNSHSETESLSGCLMTIFRTIVIIIAIFWFGITFFGK
jgi:uncharacterized membrane protein YvbJ